MIPQAIAVFFASLVFTKSFDDFRRRQEPLPVFILWITVWSSVLLVAFFPGITFWIQEHILGPQAGIGTMLGIAIMFLLFLTYRMYVKADRTERAVNRLITELAIRDLPSEVRGHGK